MPRSRPESIPEGLWLHFAAVGSRTRVARSALLWEPGERRAGRAYVIVAGVARLYCLGRRGLPVTLLMVGAGGLIGHHPDLQHQPYATGAEAVSACDVLELPAERVAAWLEARDEFGRTFVAWLRGVVNRQVVDTYERLRLERESARARVAHVLLALDRQASLSGITRQQVADLANLTLETTIRTIAELVRTHALEGARLTVLSAAERSALAGILEPDGPRREA